MKLNNALSLTILSSDAITYQGKVKAVSAVNDKGPFDVLPSHSNFISIIKDQLILHELSGEKKEMKIKRGVMKVYQDKVFVFLGIEG